MEEINRYQLLLRVLINFTDPLKEFSRRRASSLTSITRQRRVAPLLPVSEQETFKIRKDSCTQTVQDASTQTTELSSPDSNKAKFLPPLMKREESLENLKQIGPLPVSSPRTPLGSIPKIRSLENIKILGSGRESSLDDIEKELIKVMQSTEKLQEKIQQLDMDRVRVITDCICADFSPAVPSPRSYHDAEGGEFFIGPRTYYYYHF
jgi:hypothetical protein